MRRRENIQTPPTDTVLRCQVNIKADLTGCSVCDWRCLLFTDTKPMRAEYVSDVCRVIKTPHAYVKKKKISKKTQK